MRTLNDVDTYVDDYGDTKQLTIVDHTAAKKIFSNYSKEEIRQAKKSVTKYQKDMLKFLTHLDQDVLISLMNRPDYYLFSEYLLFDDEENIWLWNEVALKIHMKTEAWHPFLTLVRKIDKHVSDSRQNTTE